MASFVEGELKPQVARLVLENLLPIPLERRPGATLESALTADRVRGDFRESAFQFYTVAETSLDPKEKVEALVSLSQQLINLGRFGQARRFLGEARQKAGEFSGNLGVYFLAKVEEKTGWIEDYEGNFDGARQRFSTAKGLIEKIPQEERTEEQEKVIANSLHFLGRAHFGLAFQGKDKQINLGKAVTYFQGEVERFQKMRQEGQADAAREGFQHAWLARCQLAAGNLEEAEREIEKTGHLFDEQLEKYPLRGIKAHYHLLKGALLTRRSQFTEARVEFEKALEIRLKKEPKGERYPKGEADALMGIANTYLAEGKIGMAAVYAMRAFLTHPLVFIRPPM